jgi:glycosyltransferase involved in cell wall biosynthesis
LKIWILEIGEPLPIEKNVRLHRYGQFSQYLAKLGHEVTWWASSFSHAPKKHFSEKHEKKYLDGLCLYLIKGPGYKKNVSYARIKHTKHFSDTFLKLSKKEDLPDIIIAPIPTVDSANAAFIYAQENNIKYVVDIRDLWPDELVNLAPVPLRPFAKFLFKNSYRKMREICSKASGIMGVSNSYISYGLGFAGRERRSEDIFFPLGYTTVKNSVESISSIKQGFVNKYVSDKRSLKLCFFGTLGNYFDLFTVFKAIHQLKDEFPIQLFIGGTGSSLKRFEAQVGKLGIEDSVVFLGWINSLQIQALMELSDVGLAPYKVDAQMSLPNKPFEYMAGGLPILSSIQGELKAILDDQKCGHTYVANSVEDLVESLRWFQKCPDEAIEMGRRGRDLLENSFSNEKVFENVEKQLSNIIDPSPSEYA